MPGTVIDVPGEFIHAIENSKGILDGGKIGVAAGFGRADGAVKDPADRGGARDSLGLCDFVQCRGLGFVQVDVGSSHTP
jgi:hypothetical protein